MHACSSINFLFNSPAATARSITINEDDPSFTDSFHWWIERLRLYHEDRLYLAKGMDVTDNVINAAQKILRRQYAEITGFQDTILGPKLLFKEVPMTQKSVQILHTGKVYI